jgi:hypothetical protein
MQLDASRVIAVACAAFCVACRFDTQPHGVVDLGPTASDTGPVTAPPASDFGNPSAPSGGAGSGMSVAGAQAAAPEPAPGGADAAPPEATRDAHAPGPADADASDAMASDAGDAAEAAAPEPEPEPEPEPPPPGAAFSPCSTTSDCYAGLICTASFALVTTAAPGYCAAACGAGGTPGTCPQPGSGTVRASCQLGGTLCLLESCERARCPAGMACMRTEATIAPGQVLPIYACQP